MYESINKKRRIENNIQDFFILNMNNVYNYKDTNPINLIIINTSYNFDNNFLKTIINGGMKENVYKIITSDIVIIKYVEKFSCNFQYLFPMCDSIQINSFDNNYMNISSIIDNLQIITNLEYILDDHIFLNCKFKDYYLHFIGMLLTGYLVNIKNITIRVKTNIDNFNDFIINKIIQDDIVQKHNSYSIGLIKQKKIENVCYENGVVVQNKYVNLINFKLIDYYGKVILNDTLINLNQDALFEKCIVM
jgi:hypothetical protein